MIKKMYMLKKLSVIFLMLLVFSVSIPTHKAAAAGLGATEFTAQKTAASTAIGAVAGTAAAASTASLALKENVLDGIGWAIAKQMVSSMTRSLINWINSGFEGSPAFVTDLNAFLLDALDTAAGEYIKNLGGIGEFICSPFKLDIQAALSVSYAQARSGLPSGPTAPACKLTDIKTNIQGALSGNGGWGEWLQITNDPQNTEYGAFLEAQARLKIKIRNEAGEEKEVLGWGAGFMSKKICEGIEGSNGAEKCTISTPGNVIAEQFNFTLTAGQRSLIEADEINELIGALLNQLVLKSMEGINGLLGLSSGTGYTDYTLNGSSTKPFVDDMVEEGTLNTTVIKGQMDTALANERTYLTLASTTLNEASRRLSVVTASQNAITGLFAGGNAGAALANITRSDTVTTAKQKVSDAIRNRPSAQRRTDLAVVESQLNIISSALTIIAAMADDRAIGTDLTSLSFTRLEAEGVGVMNELTLLVNELTIVVPQTVANVTALSNMITRYNNATTSIVRAGTGTATTTKSAASIRTDIAFEYATLVTSSKLTAAAIIEQNRLRWKQKLSL